MKISPRDWPWPTRLLSAAVLVASAALGASLRSPIPVHRLADDPALVPPLPDVSLQRAPRRVAPAGTQADIATRPLFSPARRPAPVVDAGASEAVPFEYVLTSVIITEKAGIAILSAPDQRRVTARLDTEIEAAPGWRLVELGPRRAVFAGQGDRRVLDLRTFDGRGGQAPTPNVATPRRDVVARGPEETHAAAAPVRAAPNPAPRTVSAQTDSDAIRLRAELRRAQRRRSSQSN